MRSNQWCFIASWLGVFGLLAFLGSITTTPTANAADGAQVNLDAASAAAITMPVTAQSWMMWRPNQYALVEDSQSLWIGTAGGIVRWDKANHTYQRYTLLDGLPHHAVYAIAVDAAGNRWFGGDHGLSRLDANNGWTHFNIANSDLSSDLVDGIAIGADDTLWLSHGLPAGSISRRDPDGSWHWFPNRAATVASDFVRIRETRNANRLWTSAGNDIWVDYQVYNGSSWAEHLIPYANTLPIGMAADSTGQVWASSDSGVYSWNGNSWMHHVLRDFPTGGSYTTLAVGPDDVTWLGGGGTICGHMCSGNSYRAAIVQVQKPDSFRFLAKIGPIQALLPTASGVWAVGPGWLLQPDGTFYDFTNIPLYPTVTDALVDANDLLWVGSEFGNAVLQTLNDQGTATLNDDVWQTELVLGQLNAAMERTPGGDLWVADNMIRTPNWTPKRWHTGGWIEYSLPSSDYQYSALVDIFAEDETHTWFAFQSRITSDLHGEQKILALDDQGTPSDLSDDHWTEYVLATDGEGGTIAVDTLGRLWLGNSKGLYRYDHAQWQQVPSFIRVCDLVPANNGVLFVAYNDTNTDSCEQLSSDIYRVEADGSYKLESILVVVEKNLALVRSAAHRNRLWTVAPDGAVWYAWPDIQGAWPLAALHRRNDTGETIYKSPFKREDVRDLDVDSNNHVWIVANQALWRMSPTPDFSLRPAIWLLAPGDQQRQQFQVVSLGGYQASVTVTLSGLPSSITAVLEPTVVQAGDSVTVTVSVDPGAPLGDYTATLMGISSTISHTTPLTLSVVAQVHEDYLPFVAHPK